MKIEPQKFDPATEGVIAARNEAMVNAINQTIGALKVHRHWKESMPEHLIELLNSSLAPEDRV